MRRSLLIVVLLVAPAGLQAQRLQPAGTRPLNEIRATGEVAVAAEVFVREGRRAGSGHAWLEVRGEIRSGGAGAVVVEAGRCPLILVAYADPERTRPVWTGRSGDGCPESDARIRQEVTATRGHPIRQMFPGTASGRSAPGASSVARIPNGHLHFSVLTSVNGQRRCWPAGSLLVSGGLGAGLDPPPARPGPGGGRVPGSAW